MAHLDLLLGLTPALVWLAVLPGPGFSFFDNSIEVSSLEDHVDLLILHQIETLSLFDQGLYVLKVKELAHDGFHENSTPHFFSFLTALKAKGGKYHPDHHLKPLLVREEVPVLWQFLFILEQVRALQVHRAVVEEGLRFQLLLGIDADRFKIAIGTEELSFSGAALEDVFREAEVLGQVLDLIHVRLLVALLLLVLFEGQRPVVEGLRKVFLAGFVPLGHQDLFGLI
jgi:hypothetical protein